MTKRQIKSYVRRWQELLRLEEWDIRVKTVEADHIAEDIDGEGLDGTASIDATQGAMNADITLATKLSDEDIAESIRHELLHLALANLTAFTRRIVAQLGTEAQAICANEGGMLEERTVIRLERMVNSLILEQKELKTDGKATS